MSPDPFTQHTERALQQRTAGKRIFALDAMRGLAAFVVIWYHFRHVLEPVGPRWFLAPLFAGHQAVVLFFVLSGYVLSLPFWRGKQLPYRAYLVRRFFRIYVPFAAAVLLAAGISCWLQSSSTPGLTPVFHMTWAHQPTVTLLMNELSTRNGVALNTAFWSLRYEMQMSIVFPLVCWAMLRLGALRSLLAGLMIAGLGFLLRPTTRFGHSTGATLVWASCFVFGALLAWRRREIAAIYGRLSLLLKLLLLALAAVTYFSSNDFLIAIGACCALVLAQYSRAERWLDTAGPEYLGRVSYSVYLLHGTVLWALLILLYGKVWTPWIAVLFLLVTMGVSHLFCIWVEEPANRLGRRLGDRWVKAQPPGELPSA